MVKSKKKLPMVNIAVIGRGAIGLTCAYELTKTSDAHVTVIGSRSNSFTASRAAGAMLNIVSEVDIFNANHNLMRWKLANKKTVLSLWSDLMESLVADRAITKSLLFGRGTQIIVDKHSANEVERRSFDKMRDCHDQQGGKKQNNKQKENPSMNGVDGFLIDDEQSVDSQAFLEGLEKHLDIFASNINHDVLKISAYGAQWCLEIADGKSYIFDKILLCAGSWSESIIKRSPELKCPSRRSFFGVGSALLVNSELEYVKPPTVDRILRTPNRGGTCGIHAVQRKHSLYVGASSLVSDIPLKSARTSSVLALLEGLKNTLDFDIHQLSTRIITGYRPVTDDTVPIIGYLDRGIFACYGTKRDGFTWAPFYAKHIVRSIFDSSYSSAEWDTLLNECNPQRRLVSAGDYNLCIENYVLNKIYEGQQHGKSLNKQEIADLYSIAKDVHAYIKIKEGEFIGVQPELINIFYYIIMGNK